MSQLSVTVRNATLDQRETTIGASPILRLYNGTIPANCAASATGTVLATLNLPSNWMNDASAGSKTKAGTWEDTSADAAGTVTHYRIYNNGDTVCHMQGSAGDVGTEDLVLDNATLEAGQDVLINTFTWTEGNT